MAERVRVALIGCGGIARGHVEAYRRMHEQCELAYCVDVDEAKARQFAAQAGCRWGTEYGAVLGEVDAVDICTPPHLHAPMAIEAASRGKHVLTEKVMATTLEAADEMIRVAEAHGVKLMVAYVTRYDPIWQRLHQAVVEGAVGRPYLVACRTEHAPALAGWRASWETFPMGALLSHGCHYVDQMIWNFGEVAAATSVGSNTVRGPGLAREDTAAAIFRFQNGTLGNIIVSWAARHTNLYIEFNVYGTDGFLHLTYGTDGVRRLERIVDRQVERLYEYDPRDGAAAGEGAKNFVGECEHFIDCIVRDKEPLTNGRESRKSMAAILAAYAGDDQNGIVWLEPGVAYAADPLNRRARP
ncbi:MAG TPA: Gfo/Idh/MocA family oxidoreductase [Chloroflexota bacterium]|nr:Gfo/Idh/MocA family oxidoreductase [Chloroflexota bacterium]